MAAAVILFVGRAPQMLAVVAVLELGYFVYANYVTTPMVPETFDNYHHVIESLGPDDRMLCTEPSFSNICMYYGFDDVHGYDPITLRRYCDFLAAIQSDPSVAEETLKSIGEASNWVPNIRPILFSGPGNREHYECSPKLALVRARRMFCFKMPNTFYLPVKAPPMGHVQLFNHAETKLSREAILRRLVGAFDPWSTVLLEATPRQTPDPALPPGSATAVDVSSDSVEITADVPGPQILLITDAYADGWHARSLEANPPQSKYDVLPADLALRAIPLAKGHHHILMEYTPWSFTWGARITLAALAVWIAAAGNILAKHFTARRKSTTGANPA
jgi:hypothetical protein